MTKKNDSKTSVADDLSRGEGDPSEGVQWFSLSTPALDTLEVFFRRHPPSVQEIEMARNQDLASPRLLTPPSSSVADDASQYLFSANDGRQSGASKKRGKK